LAYAGWIYLGCAAVLVTCGSMLSWRWPAYLSGAMLVGLGAALLAFATHPLEALRPIADSLAFKDMGRPFIQAANRYAQGGLFWTVIGGALLVLNRVLPRR
jgi:hypothetical protein